MPARPSRLLLLEFNELCPALIQKWMKAGRLPNFQRFFDSSAVFTSEADVDDPAALDPWIQWYSIHTGLSFDQHKVEHLTDGPRAGHADLWSVLGEHQLRVGNFSSMNARGRRLPDSFHLPDPWCSSESSHPAELQVFHDYVAQQVQEYTNPDCQPAGARQFLSFLMSHGFRPKTALQIAGRLLAEKTTDRGSQWKRATILDALQFDVFRHYYRRCRPDFASFFLNSTAHFQHSYWRFMDPQVFSSEPSSDELDQYGQAIFYGYQRMDALLGDIFQLAGDDVLLVLATALSQQPFLRCEAEGGQHFYRPRDVEKLLGELEIVCASVEPVMTHQFMLTVPDGTEVNDVASRLRALTLDGKQLLEVNPRGRQIYFGCQLTSSISETAGFENTADDTTHRFFDHFYSIDVTKSGCHHPDGVLWFRTGQHDVHDEKVSVLDVFPTVTDFFGVEALEEPGLPRYGNSLLPRLHETADSLATA